MKSTWEEQGIPNPGSKEAQLLGCTCPVLDNWYGAGFPYPNKEGELITSFWTNENCPIHTNKE